MARRWHSKFIPSPCSSRRVDRPGSAGCSSSDRRGPGPCPAGPGPRPLACVRNRSRLPSLAVKPRPRGRLAVRRTTITWSGCETKTSRRVGHVADLVSRGRDAAVEVELAAIVPDLRAGSPSPGCRTSSTRSPIGRYDWVYGPIIFLPSSWASANLPAKISRRISGRALRAPGLSQSFGPPDQSVSSLSCDPLGRARRRRPWLPAGHCPAGRASSHSPAGL